MAVALNVSKVTTELNAILSEKGADSKILRIFVIMKASIHDLSEKNYLPWKSSFSKQSGYIDCIPTGDLKAGVMWGIDPNRRPFVIVQYTCHEEGKPATNGSFILFQRYPDDDFTEGSGLFARPYLDDLDNGSKKHIPLFQRLLNGDCIKHQQISPPRTYEIHIIKV